MGHAARHGGAFVLGLRHISAFFWEVIYELVKRDRQPAYRIIGVSTLFKKLEGAYFDGSECLCVGELLGHATNELYEISNSVEKLENKVKQDSATIIVGMKEKGRAEANHKTI